MNTRSGYTHSKYDEYIATNSMKFAGNKQIWWIQKENSIRISPSLRHFRFKIFVICPISKNERKNIEKEKQTIGFKHRYFLLLVVCNIKMYPEALYTSLIIFVQILTLFLNCSFN